MSVLRPLASWAMAIVLGCGSSTPEPETAAGEQAAPDDGCGATCEEVDLRGPVGAAAVGDDAVAVAARSVRGAPLLGVARIVDGRWDPRSLRLRPIEDAPGDATGLALAEASEGAVLAIGSAEGIVLLRVDGDGETTELAALGASAPSRIDVVATADGWAVGWLDAESRPHATEIHVEGGTREVEVEEVAEVAQDIALSTQGTLTARHADGEEHTEVALAGSLLGRAGEGGVTIDGEVIDDGAREGEPAHRVGASLALLATEGGWVAAYQDQTDGALVIATAPGQERRVERSDGLTRGMHIALARAGDRVFVLDLGARSTPEIEMMPFVTPVVLR